MNSATDAIPSSNTLPTPVLRASADIHETASHLIVLCNLPGVAPGDVVLEIKDQVLSISGAPRTGTPAGSQSILEYRSGLWKRTFQLHCEVQETGIQANCRHGVLQITLPKVLPAGPRRIPVTVARGATNDPSSS